ncbi:hypothetical protein FQ087_19170 [Sporosarcina sp. ANT_H38]|uniref:hypothetical protein n=1 Tax=Sporosarcina sp. ANT_H38 TaxID=2597358 RepID=UPI0011F2C9B9|nr:hypothetical protein [Sporosarcina sp. ANT_H38]KAA0944242.1 hypothetical protein FQ087_19170 [Sporosarcina sp. ANT_H38]
MNTSITKKKILSFLLVLSIIFTSAISPFDFAYAVNTSEDDNNLDTQITEQIRVVDDGLYINDTFYSKEEFEELLEQAVYAENGNEINSLAITGALAGSWVIPGVGPIVVTTAGVIIIGGAVIAAGTWAYNAVDAFFAERAYKGHKEDGTKTDGHTVDNNPSKLPKTGTPRTSRDRTADGSWNGKVLQRRYYDKNGNADLDIDYTNHGNPKAHPKVPHRHDWNGNTRGTGY